MKVLDGRELAGFVKERQANVVRDLRTRGRAPKLLIIRDSDNPVIVKYVKLKQAYGRDIGVEVEDYFAQDAEDLRERIIAAGQDPCVDGIIVQLPLRNEVDLDALLSLIAPEKDVDGLSGKGTYDSATATAINWLLAGYDIRLSGRKIALVGRGRLVGAPLMRMWRDSGLDVTVFHRGDDLDHLIDYNVIVSATGQAHLIKAEMVAEGAVVIDAGTASEGGVLVGDIDASVREKTGLTAITPEKGGVGPLTVSVLFENVINARNRRKSS